jgi:hypothetical protein
LLWKMERPHGANVLELGGGIGRRRRARHGSWTLSTCPVRSHRRREQHDAGHHGGARFPEKHARDTCPRTDRACPRTLRRESLPWQGPPPEGSRRAGRNPCHRKDPTLAMARTRYLPWQGPDTCHGKDSPERVVSSRVRPRPTFWRSHASPCPSSRATGHWTRARVTTDAACVLLHVRRVPTSRRTSGDQTRLEIAN